jgi:hypothetical protein
MAAFVIALMPPVAGAGRTAGAAAGARKSDSVASAGVAAVVTSAPQLGQTAESSGICVPHFSQVIIIYLRVEQPFDLRFLIDDFDRQSKTKTPPCLMSL